MRKKENQVVSLDLLDEIRPLTFALSGEIYLLSPTSMKMLAW